MIKLIPKIYGRKTKKKAAAKPVKKSKAPAKASPPKKVKKAAHQPSTIAQLEAASAALEKAAAQDEAADSAKPSAALTEREKLIQNAISIHREKSKMLDSLPPAVRTKLTAMAMAIYLKQRSDNEKN